MHSEDLAKKTPSIRNVATPGGVKYYGAPLGTPITAALKAKAKARNGGKTFAEANRAARKPAAPKVGVYQQRVNTWADALNAAKNDADLDKVRNGLRQDRIKGKLKDPDYRKLVAALDEKRGNLGGKPKSEAKPEPKADPNAAQAARRARGTDTRENDRAAKKVEAAKKRAAAKAEADKRAEAVVAEREKARAEAAKPKPKTPTPKAPTAKPGMPKNGEGAPLQSNDRALELAAKIQAAQNPRQLAAVADELVSDIKNGRIAVRRAQVLRAAMERRGKIVANKPNEPERVQRKTPEAKAPTPRVKTQTPQPKKPTSDAWKPREAGTMEQFQNALARVNGAKNLDGLQEVLDDLQAGAVNRIAGRGMVRNLRLKRALNDAIRAKNKQLLDADARAKALGAGEGNKSLIPDDWAKKIASAKNSDEARKLMDELEAIPEDKIENDVFNAIADKLDAVKARQEMIGHLANIRDDRELKELRNEFDNGDIFAAVRADTEERRGVEQAFDAARRSLAGEISDEQIAAYDKHFEGGGSVWDADASGLEAYFKFSDRFEVKPQRSVNGNVSDIAIVNDKKTGERYFLKAAVGQFEGDYMKEDLAARVLNAAGLSKHRAKAVWNGKKKAVLLGDVMKENGFDGKIGYAKNLPKREIIDGLRDSKPESIVDLMLFDYLVDNKQDRHYANAHFRIGADGDVKEVLFLDQGLGFGGYAGDKPNNEAFAYFWPRYKDRSARGWDAQGIVAGMADDEAGMKVLVEKSIDKLRNIRVDAIADAARQNAKGNDAAGLDRYIEFLNQRLAHLLDAKNHDDIAKALFGRG